MVVIRLVADLAILIVFFLFAPQLQGWQSNLVLATPIISLVASLISVVLINNRSIQAGLQFHAWALLLSGSVYAIFLQGLGFLICFAVVNITALIVANPALRRDVPRLLVAGAVVGISAILLDALATGAQFRLLAPPSLNRYLWLIVALLIANYGYFASQHIKDFATRTKFILSLTWLALISLTLLGGLLTANARNLLTQQANDALLGAASHTVERIDTFIEENLSAVANEAQLPSLVDYLLFPPSLRVNSTTEDQVIATLWALHNKNRDYISSYALLDLDGKVLLATASEDQLADRSNRAYFQQAVITRQPYVSDVEISPSTGQPSLYFSSPVLSGSGQVIGLLRVRYHAAVLQNLIESSNDLLGQGSFAMLLDHFLHLAHGTEPQSILTAAIPLDQDTLDELEDAHTLTYLSSEEIFLTFPQLETHLLNALSDPDGIEFFAIQENVANGQSYRAVTVKLDSRDWLLIFFQTRQAFLAPVEAYTSDSLLFALGIGLAVIALALALGHTLTKPINQLAALAAKVSQGDLTARVDIAAHGEIGALATTFNSTLEQLDNLKINLETQVIARTRALENHAAQLQTAAEVVRDATSAQELGDLLNAAAELIKERFGYYHVNLYFLDEHQEHAVLKAASGEVGAQLLQSQHKLKVGSNTAAGYAALAGEPRIATHATPATEVFHHPLLPETRAQLVLPLMVDGQILGVLDLHSDQPQTFSEDDITLFQIIADQLAIAIHKTQSRVDAEKVLRQLEAAYSRYTRNAWKSFVRSGEYTDGYRYRQKKIEPIAELSPLAKQAWQRAQPVSRAGDGDHGAETSAAISIPITVRDEVIGVLTLQFDSSNVPRDTQIMVTEIANRLGLILENARLIEAAQRRLDIERATGDVAERMRQTLEMDTVLQNAVQEIGQTLGITEVELSLNPSLDQNPSAEEDSHE